MCSLNYTAQEQTQGNAVPQSDFFSLGRTFVYLLTAKNLDTFFTYTNTNTSTNPSEWHNFVSSISPTFINLIDQLMEPAIEQRPNHADEILQKLVVLQEELYLPQTRYSIISNSEQQANIKTKITNQKGKNKNLLVISVCFGGIAILLLFGNFIWYKLFTDKSPQTSNKQCSESSLVRKSGNLYGVIEVGSTGIKGEIIQELPKPNEDGFKFISREEKIEERNAKAVEPKAQSEAVSSVKSMFDEIKTRFSIPCEQIVIYGSSGVAQKAPNKDALAKEIQKETGRVMEFISPEEEAYLVFDGVVPEWRRNEVVMIDIGSGNIKGAYLKNSNKDKHTTFDIPLGTKTFTREITNQQGTLEFTKAAINVKRKVLIPQIRDTLQRKPGVQNLSRIYLAGGISWALSTLMRPCDDEQEIRNIREERVAKFLRLYPADINTFYYNAARDRKTLFEPDLSKCTPEQKNKVKKNIEKIRKNIFSQYNLIAGAEILRALSDELKFSEKERIFFARYAIKALPTGYLKKQLKSFDGDVAK